VEKFVKDFMEFYKEEILIKNQTKSKMAVGITSKKIKKKDIEAAMNH
jgi:hypothetical protein